MTTSINPLSFKSFKNFDVEEFEEDIARELQKIKYSGDQNNLEIKKILDESEEIKQIKNKIQLAYLNKERSKQIHENQIRKLIELENDAQADDEVISKLNNELHKESQNEGKQRLLALHNKYIIQKQIKEREIQREDAKYEYERDKKQIHEIMKKIEEEDLEVNRNEILKRNKAKMDMENAYKEKEYIKFKQLQENALQKEKEREYFETLQKRDKDLKAKKQAEKDEKDKILSKLCEEKKKKEAEKEYWENVRNELYVEEMNRRQKILELEEQEKKIKQKEEMLKSAIEQALKKEEKKKKEDEEEREFKRKLLERFKEDEKMEQYNKIIKKQKELKYREEIEKQWKLKRDQYLNQKELEIMNLKNQKIEEENKRKIIEKEKIRLIKENEEILKSYMEKEYFKLKLK
jgi:hypothetical protein